MNPAKAVSPIADPCPNRPAGVKVIESELISVATVAVNVAAIGTMLDANSRNLASALRDATVVGSFSLISPTAVSLMG